MHRPPPISTLFPYTTLFRSPTGVWTHIAATWDGSTMVLYTNGAQQASQGAAGSIATTADLLAIADRKSTRLNSSHLGISYAVFCLKKKKEKQQYKQQKNDT